MKTIIEVKFLAGTDIEQALNEAKQKAKYFDVAYITFNFNGVIFNIGRNCNVADALEQYAFGKTSENIDITFA